MRLLSFTESGFMRVSIMAAILAVAASFSANESVHAAPPTVVPTAIVPPVLLRDKVTKTRRATVSSSHLGRIVRDDDKRHVYYLVFTAAGQTSRSDFSPRNVSIMGDPGSIVATDGVIAKVVCGRVKVWNGGLTSLVVLSAAKTIVVSPGSDTTVDASDGAVPAVSQTAGDGQISESSDSSQSNDAVAESHPVLTAVAVASSSKSITEPARLWAEPNCQFGVTANGTIELIRGQLMVVSAAPTKVHTCAGSVECSARSIVAIKCSESGLSVENVSYFHAVNIASHGHTIRVSGGCSAILVNGAPDAEKIPADGVERRKLYAQFDGYMTVLKSEFRIVSLMKTYRSVRMGVCSPVSPYEKKLMDGLVKDIAIYSSVYGEPEDYSQKPELLATYKLGAFFNPFFTAETAPASPTQ